ncbi:MAG TPA: class I SAM-dependent methyltransferase [Solirubrobacteraceae bacterium]|jgi:trans-aconitate methyltransferase|nr:class I SAM-dependent methyltransferase [Solirubrobacteraceae bacterium]
MTDATLTVDWAELMTSWDRQQEGYLPTREERFRAMFDAIEVLVGEEFLALDLACGPGSISQRLLHRFPSARSVAVDVDPVLLALGRGALGTVDGRLRWIERDLRGDDWSANLSERPFDVVLSTTALHWLTPPQLVVVYRRLATMVRPGGIVLNGDHMPFDRSQPSLVRLTRALEARQEQRAFEHEEIENWDRWWARLAEIPALAELLAKREEVFRGRRSEGAAALWEREDGEDRCPSRGFAGAALAQAGFAEVGAIWQDLDDYILLAVR